MISPTVGMLYRYVLHRRSRPLSPVSPSSCSRAPLHRITIFAVGGTTVTFYRCEPLVRSRGIRAAVAARRSPLCSPARLLAREARFCARRDPIQQRSARVRACSSETSSWARLFGDGELFQAYGYTPAMLMSVPRARQSSRTNEILSELRARYLNKCNPLHM